MNASALIARLERGADAYAERIVRPTPTLQGQALKERRAAVAETHLVGMLKHELVNAYARIEQYEPECDGEEVSITLDGQELRVQLEDEMHEFAVCANGCLITEWLSTEARHRIEREVAEELRVSNAREREDAAADAWGGSRALA